MGETTHKERTSHREFAWQLWVENPAAHEWLNLKRQNVRDPLIVGDLQDLLDTLGS